MNTKNVIILTLAIAAVLLVAMIGSASAGCIGVDTGTDYGCGDTVTESCTFNGNISCTDTSKPGLEVGADGITINGAGHTITGNRENSGCGDAFQTGPAEHSGIVNTEYDNAVIKNLEIENFCTGIALYYTGSNYADKNTVTDCEIHNCGNSTAITHGIHLLGVNNCTITKNRIYYINGTGPDDGCGGGGNGIFLHGVIDAGGDGNNITYNNLSYNEKSGFFTKFGCMHNNISNNIATGNVEGGIVLMCMKSNYNIIENNNASGNTYYGIYIGSSNNTIINNIANNNGYYGIHMARSDGSYDNELYENTACGNVYTDIRTCGPECYGNTGDNNTCNTTSSYNDTGSIGCTFTCGGEEGACVGATQCFTCGDTVTESCTLNGNMSCTDATKPGLEVGASGITINGSGYKITGSENISVCGNAVMGSTSQVNPAIHSGIVNNDDYDNVVIENLEIENFCSGVTLGCAMFADNVDNNTVRNCRIHDNGNGTTGTGEVTTHGIHMVATNNCVITENTIYNNNGTGTGCGDGGNGIFMHGDLDERGDNNKFTHNNFSYNGKSGFFTKYKCMHSIISNNTATGNGEAGITLMCKHSSYSIIEHNNASENPGDGIIIGGYNNTIRNNIVNNNGGIGIDMRRSDGSYNNELYGNTVCGNGDADISTCGAECYGNTGDNNTCNTTSSYNDTGSTGCTFTCGGDEGACVGATQCFTCGDTVTESCTLNGDMTCKSGHGLIVGAGDIIIDGNDYKITGSENATVCTGIGETGAPYGICGILNVKNDNVEIKNLEIENFCTGIRLQGDDIDKAVNNTISNCSIHHNGNLTAAPLMVTHGIHTVYARNLTITKNAIYNNTGSGSGCGDGGNGIFMFGGGGDYPDDLDYNVISCNKLYNNAKGGFWMKMKLDSSKITYNRVWGNGWDTADSTKGGIIMRCKKTDHNYVAFNNASYNPGLGMYVGGCNNTIKYNIITNNTEHGINIGRSDGGDYNEIYHNTICNNSYTDIRTCGGDCTWSMGDGCCYNTGNNNTCGVCSNCGGFNSICCNYTCPGAADLNITDKYEQWSGETYNVIYTIKNLGHSTAPESTTGIYIDGALAKTDSIGLIGPGESYIRTVGPFTMSGDDDTILVCADKDDAVNETDETNNCLENVFTGVVMPDLVITEKSEAWVDLVNKTYNVTYTVKNIGNADANASTTAIIIDGTEAKNDTVGLLAPQATHTAELGPFTMSGETDTIRVCADNESSVTESNEDNNCLQNTFEHPGIPDLVISKKYEEWVASNETDQNYTITYTVKNVGTGDAGASTTAIIIDGIEKANDSIGALGEGDSYTNTLGPFTMSNESDTIKVCADKNNEVEESNEDNNCTENTFEYTAIGCLAEDGTLFRCGNTVTTNCTFNGDMSCPLTDGLKIGASNITIDGNSSVLDGTGCTLDAMSRSGIYNPGYDDVTVEDLEVKGFCHGLYLNNVYRNTIAHCDIHHNGNASTTAGLFGITMKYVYNSTIRNNTVHHQIAFAAPNPACEDGGNGMFLYKGCYNNIIENEVYNNTKGGIFIKMKPMHNNISYNDLWDNGQGGIILRCMMSNYNLIEHNNASNNYGSGMFIGAKNNTVRHNRICNNRDGGPYYQDSVGGHGYGINLGRSDGSFDNYLHDNEICGNDYKDIYIVSGVTGNHGINNTCDTTYNYGDDGTTGCTLFCGGTTIIAGFTAEPTKGAVPLTVNFTDKSKAKEGIESWSWNFDDGATSEAQNATHTYETTDAYSYYNVSLTVNESGSGGLSNDTDTKPEYIKVWKPDAALNADFVCSKGVGATTEPVVFTDKSIGEVNVGSWLWDFGDGNTSTEQKPVYYYSEEGIYMVSLTVTGPGGTSKDTKFNCTRVGPGSGEQWPLIDAHFFASTRTGYAPFTVQFTDMSRSEGNITSWLWDFGDGNMSDERNPTHTYDSLGTYNVSIETTSTTGAKTRETKTEYISVLSGEYIPTTPFVINGRTFNIEGGELSNCTVTIENLNTNANRTAKTSATSNYYQLVLGSDNVSAGDTLRFNATKEAYSNTTYHTVTQEGIYLGGVFSFNLTLTAPNTTPPASITGLANSTYAQTYINWTWTNPGDGDFNHTMVYINGSWEENVSTPLNYYNATGLSPSTNNTISTHTVDTSGNINQTWVNHTARTAAAAVQEGFWLQTTDADFNAGTRTNINVSGDAFQLSAVPSTVTIFHETFPNADGAWDGSSQDESGWVTIQGDGDPDDIQVSDEDKGGSSPSGGNHLTFEDCDHGFHTPEDYDIAYVSINLSGYNGVEISYYRQSDDVDSDEGLRVAYSTDSTDGKNGTWTLMDEYINEADDVWLKDTYPLPDANCTANFKLRFSAKMGSPNEHMYVDDVMVTGEKAGGYKTSGSLISQAHDTGASEPAYTDIIVGNSTPEGTTITVEVRAASTEAGLNSTAWHTDIANVPHEQWVQWNVSLTGDGTNTPTVDDVNVTWTSEPDTTAPAAVEDLAASEPTSSSIKLTWTAPGDDGNTGNATSYDIRYSTTTINESNWDSAINCTGEPAPQPAGSSETFTVINLTANTTYYFALKTSDEVPNESPLSNVANGTTESEPENQPPVSDPSGPYEGTEGVPITFDGSGSYDPDGSIVSYEWDFGDGNNGTGVSPNNTYTQNGTYTVNLTVTDNKNATDVNTTTATVTSAPVVTTYNFTAGAGLNKWAYLYQHNMKPPATNEVPDIEFTSSQYGRISTDNRKMQSDSTNSVDNYAVHRFKFDIAEPVGGIDKIEVLWNGKGGHGDKKNAIQGATLYIWNFSSGAYDEQLDRTTSKNEVDLTGVKTANIGNYVDTTGNLTILVEQNTPQQGEKASKISTDYVKVDITHT